MFDLHRLSLTLHLVSCGIQVEHDVCNIVDLRICEFNLYKNLSRKQYRPIK